MEHDMNELDRMLEASAPPPANVVEGELSYPEFDPEEEMMNALLEGMSLLTKAQTLFKYISDPLLCVSLTKRERTSISRLNAKIEEHLAEVQAMSQEEL